MPDPPKKKKTGWIGVVAVVVAIVVTIYTAGATSGTIASAAGESAAASAATPFGLSAPHASMYLR